MSILAATLKIVVLSRRKEKSGRAESDAAIKGEKKIWGGRLCPSVRWCHLAVRQRSQTNHRRELRMRLDEGARISNTARRRAPSKLVLLREWRNEMVEHAGFLKAVSPRDRERLGRLKRASALLLLYAAAAVGSPAQTFTNLVNFAGTNGENPFYVSLVQGTDGNFYGTTMLGGAYGRGLIFSVTSDGSLTTVHSFHHSTGGAYLYAGLVLATDGDFYGITEAGGAYGRGTFFKINSAGMLTTLYSFSHHFPQRALQSAGPIQAKDGNFYGISYGGGTYGYGTVFKLTPGGKLTILHSFTGRADGQHPSGGLVEGMDRNLYGTTQNGGDNGAYGTVFKITPTGALTTLHSFDGMDGSGPVGGLVEATDGNFYGTTSQGGTSTACYNGCGTIFKITPSGALTTLHSFSWTDGNQPYDSLVQATDGNLYGTTAGGGTSNGYGTIFSISPDGTFTTLHIFDQTDGSSPDGGLLQATDGNFYGITTYGAVNNCPDGCGTVFSLSVGLGPFVKTLPTSGKVGTSVKIMGTDLTNATSVSFNGTAVEFTVVSATEVTTTVPVGATTGEVQVTTSSGMLSSDLVFRVDQ
jgi:uncharacterized repeat protein (TIGR03803 family)